MSHAVERDGGEFRRLVGYGSNKISILTYLDNLVIYLISGLVCLRQVFEPWGRHLTSQ